MIDWTDVHGHSMEIKIDEGLSFQTDHYTPVLLALALNKLDLARYLLEEVGLSLSTFLYKPRDSFEVQIMENMKRKKEDYGEYRSIKKKAGRYNRIISIVIACKHQNEAML